MAQQFRIREVDVTKGLETFNMVAQQNARLKAAQQAQERMALQAMGMDLRERALELRDRQALQSTILAEERLKLARQASTLEAQQDLLRIARADIALKNESKETEDEVKLQSALQIEDARGMPLAARMVSPDKKTRDMARQEFSTVRTKFGLNMPGKRASREIYNLFRQADQMDAEERRLNPPQKPKEISAKEKQMLAKAQGDVTAAEQEVKAAENESSWFGMVGPSETKIQQKKAKLTGAQTTLKSLERLTVPFVLNPPATPPSATRQDESYTSPSTFNRGSTNPDDYFQKKLRNLNVPLAPLPDDLPQAEE